MVFIVGIGIIVFLFASIIMVWVNKGEISNLRWKIGKLEEKIALLTEDSVEEEIHQSDLQEELAFQVEAEPKTSHIPPTVTVKKISFEERFGAKLPVWIGGIALALAGFFLVKYSIEMGILTPKVRIILGIAFGFALLYCGNWVYTRPAIANEKKIGQSLCGAGIAVLYVSVFAGTTLYDLVPPLIGFFGMAITTAIAVVLSLRYGFPIAIIGLVGGFLTPALINTGDPSAPLLFGYLYLIFTGLMVVIRQKNWWFLSIPTMMLAFLWVMVWLILEFHSADTIWLGLFILAVCGTCIASSEREFHPRRQYFTLVKTLNYAGITLGLALMATVSFCGEFGLMEWLLFGTLTVGGIALAYFKEQLYGFVPLLTMLTNALMLFSWGFFTSRPSELEFAITLLSFASIYIISGIFTMWKAKLPILWASLVGSTAVGYFLIGYFKITTPDIPLFWGTIGLTLGAVSVFIIYEIQKAFRNCITTQYLLAIFSMTTVAFVSLALSIELEREFLSIAFASEILAVAWINSQFNIKALRLITGILACIFAFLLFPQIILMVELAAQSLLEIRMHMLETPPILNNPLFQLGLPALMFVIAGYFLRIASKNSVSRSWREDIKNPDWLVFALETVAVALAGLMFYYITRKIMHVDENILMIKAGFFERGILTNIFFIYGLACLLAGRKFFRLSFSISGFALCGFAIFRVIYFDMLMYNPLWTGQNVGNWIILNALLITYGFPIVWSYYTSIELNRFDENNRFTPAVKFIKTFILFLIFTFITLNVRQIFHGDLLNIGGTTNAEIYSYSAAWLLLGIGLLLVGIAKKSQMIRYTSLTVLLLVVGKVFLYDASELEGLYRVASFFGLGLCLIGISYFYTRFVFVNPNNKTGKLL